MSEVELKKKLTSAIKTTDDHELLYQIFRLLKFELSAEEVYKVSTEERKAIDEGISQIDNGEFLSHEEANKRVDEWLKR